MANINTLTFASSNTYQNILNRFGYIKDTEAVKLLVLDFLFDLSTESDYVYKYSIEDQKFQADPLLTNFVKEVLYKTTDCLMRTSCLINDMVSEVNFPDPPTGGGGTEPPIDIPAVEYTFDGGVTWFKALAIGHRQYEVVFEGIPTVMTCGWRFSSGYSLTDFQIYSNSAWVPEVYYGETSNKDRWEVFVGTDERKYFYWNERNSQGRPGVIYGTVKYRFRLTI